MQGIMGVHQVHTSQLLLMLLLTENYVTFKIPSINVRRIRISSDELHVWPSSRSEDRSYPRLSNQASAASSFLISCVFSSQWGSSQPGAETHSRRAGEQVKHQTSDRMWPSRRPEVSSFQHPTCMLWKVVWRMFSCRSPVCGRRGRQRSSQEVEQMIWLWGGARSQVLACGKTWGIFLLTATLTWASLSWDMPSKPVPAVGNGVCQHGLTGIVKKYLWKLHLPLFSFHS